MKKGAGQAPSNLIPRRLNPDVPQYHSVEPAQLAPRRDLSDATRHTIDDYLIAVICAEIDKLKRIMADVPDGASVDLSLVKLPPGALLYRSSARRFRSRPYVGRAT